MVSRSCDVMVMTLAINTAINPLWRMSVRTGTTCLVASCAQVSAPAHRQ